MSSLFLQQLDPSKSRVQTKKPPARDLICMSCDEKASKVVLDPCGHLVDVVCLGKCNFGSFVTGLLIMSKAKLFSLFFFFFSQLHSNRPL